MSEQPEQPPTQHEAPTPQRPQDERTVESPSTSAPEPSRGDARPQPGPRQELRQTSRQEPDRAERGQRWGVSHPWRAVQLADGTHVGHHGAHLSDAQVDEARQAAENHGMTLQLR